MPDHPSNRPTPEGLVSLFTFHPPGDAQVARYSEIRSAALRLAAVILDSCPPCADTTAAIRKVREAVMTANAAIALVPPEADAS